MRRWRLTYVLRSQGITEDEPSWTDKTHVWNFEGIKTNAEAAEKVKTFLEDIRCRNCSIQEYNLVRIVQ